MPNPPGALQPTITRTFSRSLIGQRVCHSLVLNERCKDSSFLKAAPKRISAAPNDPPKISKPNTSILANLKRIGSNLCGSEIVERVFSWRQASFDLPQSDYFQVDRCRALPPKLHIQGHPLNVTLNLRTRLQRLRSYSRAPRKIAICGEASSAQPSPAHESHLEQSWGIGIFRGALY
jgi:hypothetical protein